VIGRFLPIFLAGMSRWKTADRRPVCHAGLIVNRYPANHLPSPVLFLIRIDKPRATKDKQALQKTLRRRRRSFTPAGLGTLSPPNVIVDGNDPIPSNYTLSSNEEEASLDTEIAGGIAPGATINFYTAADTTFQQGVNLTIARALDDNVVNILSASFGLCEAYADNGFILAAWEQAAAQGITVTVSTGDAGSAGCDDSTYNSTSIASNSPFKDQHGNTSIVAGGGGSSGCINATVAADGSFVCNPVGHGSGLGYPKPSWQAGSGVPGDAARDLPDVFHFANNGSHGSAWAVCFVGDCTARPIRMTSVDFKGCRQCVPRVRRSKTFTASKRLPWCSSG
jgi:hypothetical protein